jgi:hypothetical protein
MKRVFFLLAGLLIASFTFGQQFEQPKLDGSNFTKVQAHLGADFALQYQALTQSADGTTLTPLGKGLNLPTANMKIYADLAPGVQVHLTTYLSSRHHEETWVKGGYLLMDQLPFLNSDVINKIMEKVTLKVGMMEINYGDQHFRRSDNGNVTRNAFVGNYIMDGFTTAGAIEAMYRNNGWIAMAAVSNGALKPSLVSYNASTQTYTSYNTADQLAYYGKVGFDKQLNENFRLRATVSLYSCAKNNAGSLYYGDRAGSRYYLVMKPETNSPSDVDQTSNHTTGRWGPGFTSKDNSEMFNLFAKWYGLEVFGTIEKAKGTTPGGNDFDYNQYAIEGLYHFGGQEQFYVGTRYNKVKNSDSDDMSVDRVQIAGGWHMTKNIVAKLEYVDQNYNNFALYGNNAEFKGVMFEAGISF